MPIYTIEAPDGRKIKIEAENQDLAVQGAQEYAKSNPVKPQGKREGSDVTVGSVARSLFRGIPFIGTYRDEMMAKVREGLGEGSYEDTLAKERGKDAAFAEAHPILDTGLGVAGGIGGTLLAAPAVGAAGTGGALAAAGRLALGLGAKTLPGAVARGAAAGALQGAAAGSGDAEGGFAERGVGALGGAAVGGALGAALPAAFEGTRRLGSAALNRVAGERTPLSSLSSGAQRYVGQISTPEQVAQWDANLQRLGSDAMLADVSPEWQMVARGAAARPGSREVVVGALNARDAAKNQRLGADLDESIGRAVVPSQVDAAIQGRQEALGVDYGDVFRGAAPVDTSGLAAQLDEALTTLRGKSAQAVGRIRNWLDEVAEEAGEDGRKLSSDPTVLFQIRQEIDGVLGDETNAKVIRELTAARREVDGLLANSVAGLKDVDANFQELARQRAGLQRGNQVLDSGKTAPRPQEIAQEVQAGALPEGNLVGPSASNVRLRQGTRAEIDRVAGQNANDPIALRNLVKGEGDWNRDKLRTVFGQERADRALAAIDREAQFRDTFNRVTSGSDTGATRGFQEFLDRAENGIGGGGGSGDLTAFGAAVTGAKRVAMYLMGELGKDRANRYATELARVSIAQGVTRDEFVSALRRAGVKQQAISRALGQATKYGLIASREAPKYLPTSENQRQ